MWRSEDNFEDFFPFSIWVCGESNSDHHAWQQAPSPAEPSCWPFSCHLRVSKGVGVLTNFYFGADEGPGIAGKLDVDTEHESVLLS